MPVQLTGERLVVFRRYAEGRQARLRAGVGAVVGLLLAVSGCTSGEPATQQSQESIPDGPGPAHGWCATRQGEKLTCVENKGKKELVAVVRWGTDPSADLVLWDPGGPGLGLPDDDATIAALLPAAIRDRNVVLAAEPWVNYPPTEECLSGAFEAAPPATCAQPDLVTSDRHLRETVELVESETGHDVVGAYVQSFGATRSLPTLASVLPGGWVVVESPGPRPGTSALELMRARRAVVMRTLHGGCRDTVCRSKVTAGVVRATSEGEGTTSGREVALGLIAVTTTPTDNARLIAALRRDLTAAGLGPANLDKLRRLGRLYEGKRPGGLISPSLVALWADTCPRLADWRELGSANDPILSAFAWVFRGCGLRWDASGIDMSNPDLSVIDLLVLSGSDDPVVPPAIQGTWAFPKARVRHEVGTGHFWESDQTVARIRKWINTRWN